MRPIIKPRARAVPSRFRALTVCALLLVGCQRSVPNGPNLAGGRTVAYWVNALNQPDPKLRREAVFKLGNVGATDPSALPAVSHALRDQDAAVRREAILALVKFGPEASRSVPVLRTLTQRDPNAHVRLYAAKALAMLQSEH